MMRASRRKLAAATISLLVLALALAISGANGAEPRPLEVTQSSYVYLPLVAKPCSPVYGGQFTSGPAFQQDTDNPVRPAYAHADKNLELRGYTPNTDTGLVHELVSYGPAETPKPPQLATIFEPSRVPTLTNFYRVHDWIWAPSPEPGTRGDPITAWPVTALGMETTPGEVVHVPVSDYDIGGGMEALVLFADEDTVALRYTRDDSSGWAGYTVHLDNVCTDPNLLALYNSLDDPSGPRYLYVESEYSYPLPNVFAGQPLGSARDSEIVVSIVDTGGFMDTRSCNDWWQIRPGYTVDCEPAAASQPR